MIKKTFTTILISFTLTLSLFAWGKKNEVPTLVTNEDCVFWEINGKDKKGNDSKLYVLGTFHLADERLQIPEKVIQAFDSADRLVGEMSLNDWQDIMFATLIRQGESGLRENKRVRETGKPLMAYFSEEQLDFLLQMFGGNQAMIANLCAYEPWVLSSNVNLIPAQMSGLNPNMGVDQIFIQRAMMSGRYIEGLDTLDEQLDILSFGDWETQLEMLLDSIDELMENTEEAVNYMKNIYNAYLEVDIEELNTLFEEDKFLDEENSYSDEYYETLIVDRNTSWADKFSDYLNEGGTTFIFAGTAHFVGEDSVFEIMKDNKTLKF